MLGAPPGPVSSDFAVMGGAGVVGVELGYASRCDQVSAGAGVDRLAKLPRPHPAGNAGFAHTVPLRQLGHGVGLLLPAGRQSRGDFLDQRIRQGIQVCVNGGYGASLDAFLVACLKEIIY